MKPALLMFSAVIASSVIWASASANAAAQPKPFSYRVKVPAEGGSCDQHAQEVASLFAASTRAKSVTGSCHGTDAIVDQGKTYRRDIVIVDYLSDLQLAPERSVFGGTEFQGHSDQTSGLFATYADCLGAMAKQRALFVTNMGKAPVAAYCTASTSSVHTGFSLTFESFGESKRHLYSYAQDGMVASDSENVVRAAVSALNQAGANVVWSDASHLFYYSENEITLAVEYLGTYSVASQCSDQLLEAQKIFAKAGLTGVSSFCDPFDTAVGASSTLKVVGAGPEIVSDDLGGGSDRYETFADCMSDRDRVIANATSSGRAVLGALCQPANDTSNVFITHVYSNL
jgi:hypothetical protein